MSDAGRYLVRIAVFAGFILLGTVALSFAGFRYGLLSWHFSQLLDYQLDKLEKAPPVDLLLVGDSSLGNAVDARAWSQALQSSVLSVALTGTYGYGGSYNMIRRALRRHPVKTIVVFNTVKLMLRPDAGQGALFAAENFPDFDIVPPGAIFSLVSLATPINILSSFFAGRADKVASYTASDYVPQGRALPEFMQQPPTPPPLDPSGILRDHWPFLSAIGRLCQERKLQCLYVHGPLGERECGQSDGYLSAVNDIVRAAGLKPIDGTPVCMPWPETGDAEDHVHPKAKALYSARYLALVKSHLAAAAR